MLQTKIRIPLSTLVQQGMFQSIEFSPSIKLNFDELRLSYHYSCHGSEVVYENDFIHATKKCALKGLLENFRFLMKKLFLAQHKGINTIAIFNSSVSSWTSERFILGFN